jgi:ABC-2 type transport system ATP-binding protein
LELVGLTEKKGALIGALSRGMQQRIGLARVLIHDPQLLLLDEPASGLDPRARIEMMAILQELQQMGKTIIISSHILSELQNLCNRVAIIEQGKLIYSGDVEGVAKQLSRDRVILASIQGDWEKAIGYLKARSEIADVQWDKDRLRITMADQQSNVGVIAQTLVANQIDLLSLTEDQLGLEEVFMRVTRGDTQ